MIFYATSGHVDGGIFEGACFVRAPSMNVAKLMATNLGVFPTKVISLPLLADQIPDEYIGRRLSSQYLSEIDVMLGGDGTGRVPADMRRI